MPLYCYLPCHSGCHLYSECKAPIRPGQDTIFQTVMIGLYSFFVYSTCSQLPVTLVYIFHIYTNLALLQVGDPALDCGSVADCGSVKVAYPLVDLGSMEHHLIILKWIPQSHPCFHPD